MSDCYDLFWPPSLLIFILILLIHKKYGHQRKIFFRCKKSRMFFLAFVVGLLILGKPETRTSKRALGFDVCKDDSDCVSPYYCCESIFFNYCCSSGVWVGKRNHSFPVPTRVPLPAWSGQYFLFLFVLRYSRTQIAGGAIFAYLLGCFPPRMIFILWTYGMERF